jgi:hypothetical protein
MLGENEVIRSPKLDCPFLGKKCIQEKCMLWASYSRADKKVYETCSIAFLPVLMSQQISESISNAAAIESFRNVVAEGARQFMQLAASRGRLPDAT